MFSGLGKIISLKNLTRLKISTQKKKNNYIFETVKSIYKRGQIATLFILMIIFVLIFTLVVINIGNVTNRLTQISNAIDSAGLYLGSQLASKSHMLYESLGNKTKKCKKGGLLGVVLAIIGAIIGFVIGGPGLAAVIGGAIGGAIGGSFTANNPLKGMAMGAIQGAMIGAAIAGGASLLGGTQSVAGAGGATFEVGGGAAGSSTGGLMVFEAGKAISGWVLEGGTLLQGSVVTAFASTTGAIIGGSLAVGASIYTGLMMDKSLAAGMENFVKALNGLPDYERIREGVFLQVLSKTVDDPNKVTDTTDIDCDGKTDDKVPAFLVWWDKHIKDLKESLISGVDVINNFVNNSLRPFKQNIEEFLSEMDRKEVECDCVSCDAPPIELWRALEDCNYEVSFWEPGPDKASLVGWYKKDCESCPVPSGYDDVDGARYHLEEFIDYAEGILKHNVGDLDKNYDWVDYLYNPGRGNDFYNDLESIVSAMGEWIEETIDIRNNLTPCQLEYIITPCSVKESIKDEPSCNNYNPPDEPIYPCNWTQDSREVSGVILPNPVCKLYADDKNKLTDEIGIVREFVRSLKDRIREGEFFDVCSQDNCSLVGEVEIESLKISLKGNIHSPCERRNLGEGRGTISYNFHYRYTCRCCHEECDDEGNCNTICEDNTYEGDKQGVEQLSTPDLQIPSMGEEAFLGVLDEMEEKLNSVDDEFATIDIRWDDEFRPVLDSLESRQKEISDFLSEIEEFYNQIHVIETTERAEDGGGSITYSWQDKRGGTLENHSITVEVGPFKLARLEKKESGCFLVKKICLIMKDYKDNGERTWIKVTRKDPDSTNKKVGILGIWNPRIAGEITKECYVYYSYDKVGIKSVRRSDH